MQSEKAKNPCDEEVVKKLSAISMPQVDRSGQTADHSTNRDHIYIVLDKKNPECVINGLSHEKIAQDGIDVPSLEVFFSGFPRMVGLHFFPRLCQLTIVDQKVAHIEALEHCPLLKELWIVQCHLTEICGLQNCLLLEKLYLYHNQISQIQNLELLVNLEKLWLSNNRITKIEGLDTLINLKELNLADNLIEKIGDSLHPNESLRQLNLSGNRIISFKELTPLAHLPNLVELDLQDRASIPNPVCLLCNYATHVLYHMPGLQRLDGYHVSSKMVKESAESAVMKKKMYYNMRVRTAQRSLAETQWSLTEKKKSLLQVPKECIKTLSHSLKSLERELSMVPRGCKKSASILEGNAEEAPKPEEGLAETSDSASDAIQDAATEQKILLKTEALKERLEVWTRRLDEIEACYESDLAQATKRTEYTVQFLLMELESVGNIRLEEGNPTDLWFASCSDLLRSRFAPSDYKVHGIVDIKINRVIRINNSALRVRFEEKLHSLIADDSTPFSQRNYRQQLDYLFYIPDPEKCEKEETLCILEEGFKTEQLKALGGEVAIPLSNSLSVTERPRIEYALMQASQSNKKKSVDTLPFRHGQVIVSKAFVGNSSRLRAGEPLDRRSHATVFSVYRSVDTKPKSAKSKERPASTKTHECHPCRMQWFMFDRELVLPEYIVFFEYISTDKGASLLNQSPGEETSSPDIILDGDVLDMEPVLKRQPKRFSLDEEFLRTVARANLLSQITVLNLHSNNLSRIKEIARLRALRHLTVTFNRLTRLDDISHMPSLEFLDVSFNELVTLEGLRGLGRLKQLDLRWNQLTKAREDAAVLRKHTPALLQLDTRYNPWSRPQSVRMTVLSRLPALTHLDDELVCEEEAAEAVQMDAGAKINQASLLAHSRSDSDRPRSLSLLSTAQLVSQLSLAPWSLCAELEPDWMEKVTSLNLDNLRITQMTGLSKLVNLRWASFNDNEISTVGGLDSCVKLEELSLNNNSISTLNGLTSLHCLTKLSMDGNQLSSLDSCVLSQLPNLSFLSLEKNCITSLQGIQRLRSLLEFYIGRNQISTSRDIFYLKGLANLIILDLYGNPLVEKLENYRIYVVFHLASLKALDGVAVEMSESESAKSMFRGRLTTDMIAEKLGHSNYTKISDLTLQSCSIRTVDLCPADLFQHLRSVNLDHNSLTSFSGLISLRNIQALSLNYNHIESLLPKQKTQAHLTNRQKLNNKVQSSGYGLQSASKVSRDAGLSGSLEPLMGSLEVLHLSHNGISNMANLQLSRLTNLKALFLQGNEISQVEGLEGLDQLRELVLDRNRIKALAKNSFTAQSVLLELRLTENRIRELNHLDPLTELRRLFLDKNKLQDIAELEKLKVLPSLAELSVAGNPVARNSLHRPAVVLGLSQLQVLDGVTVTLEERTMAELPAANESPCLQSCGAPLAEINLPGLFPLTAQNPTLRGVSVSGGQLSIMPANLDKKPKCSSVACGGQADSTVRHVQRPGGGVATLGPLPDGSRVTVTHGKQEQDSRRPNDGRPPPM